MKRFQADKTKQETKEPKSIFTFKRTIIASVLKKYNGCLKEGFGREAIYFIFIIIIIVIIRNILIFIVLL